MMDIGLLRRGDGFADLVRLPWSSPSVRMIMALRPDSWLSFSLRGQVDGVIEQRALGIADRGNRPAAQPGRARRPVAAGGIDLRLVHGPGQQAGAVGEVLQQVDVHIERQQERLVLGLEHPLQELAAGLLFQRKHALLAARGIQQNAQRQGQIVLGNEALPGLRLLVFGDRAVVLVEVGNEVAVLVLDGKKHVHQVDLELEGGDGLVLLGSGRGMAHRRGIGRGRKLGPSRTAGEGKKHEEGGKPAEAHVSHDRRDQYHEGSITEQWRIPPMRARLKTDRNGRVSNLRRSGASDTLTVGRLDERCAAEARLITVGFCAPFRAGRRTIYREAWFDNDRR